MKKIFNADEWADLVTEADPYISSVDRVAFLLYMRRNASKPRLPVSPLLEQMWGRREGIIPSGDRRP